MSWRFDWLRQRHAALELLFYFLIVVTTITLCAPYVSVILDKARMLDALSLLSNARGEMVLEYAHIGELAKASSEGFGGQPVAETTKGMEYVRQQSRLVARGSLSPTSEKRRDAITEGAAQSPRPIVLSLRPAVPQSDPAWSVLWLCGERVAPAGWLSPSEGIVLGLTRDQTPLICRNTTITP